MDEIERIEDAVLLCNRRDIIRQEAEDYQELAERVYYTLEEYKKITFLERAPRVLFVIISIALGFGLDFLLISIAIISGSDFLNGLIVGFVGPIVGVVSPFIIYNAVLKKMFYATQKEDYNNYVMALRAIDKERPEIISMMNNARERLNKLENYMRDEENCIIPESYWDNANLIYALIKNKRAYDLVSAINKFEDIMHQMRMERIAQESLEWQQIAAYNSEIAAENAAIAAENSRAAAINSGISAMFSIANYYDNHY